MGAHSPAQGSKEARGLQQGPSCGGGAVPVGILQRLRAWRRPGWVPGWTALGVCPRPAGPAGEGEWVRWTPGEEDVPPSNDKEAGHWGDLQPMGEGPSQCMAWKMARPRPRWSGEPRGRAEGLPCSQPVANPRGAPPGIGLGEQLPVRGLWNSGKWRHLWFLGHRAPYWELGQGGAAPGSNFLEARQ